MRRRPDADVAAWSRVEPPAALDALVQQRAGAVLERRRAEAPVPLSRQPVPVAAKSPRIAFEIMSFARQLTGSAARLLWRAVAG